MSTLTSRELVQRTLRHELTPRVPRHLWLLPWAEMHYPDAVARLRERYPDDICMPTFPKLHFEREQGDPFAVGTYVDEWGCAFENVYAGMIGEVKRPLVISYESDLEKATPPREWLGLDVDAINRACDASDAFCWLPSPVRPFERLQFLRGTEAVYRDLLRQPAGFRALLDRIHTFNCEVLDVMCRTRVDAVHFLDDWGSQEHLLIRPRLWRELFKPLYREYCDILHRAGKFAFMHSDGAIDVIYDDLIEVGVDAINSQLFCMDIEDLGRRFGGRITFWGEIDRQHVLAFGSVDEVHAAVRRVARALYRGQGGAIAQCEFGPGARPENVEAVFAAWEALDAGRRHSG